MQSSVTYDMERTLLKQRRERTLHRYHVIDAWSKSQAAHRLPAQYRLGRWLIQQGERLQQHGSADGTKKQNQLQLVIQQKQ